MQACDRKQGITNFGLNPYLLIRQDQNFAIKESRLEKIAN